ncbi:MAG: MFS transporter [Proteobacteria bacterium]|nr:MAG: MFS transporter [Pseudomonadota bacterium]
MKIWKVLLQRNMFINFVLGFSSGIPLLLTSKTLQGWLSDANMGLTVIGLAALIGLPYTLKFLWAPIFDRFSLPFLGRRRGWLLAIQAALAGAILFVAATPPGKAGPLAARVPEFLVGFLAWLSKDLPLTELSLTLIGGCFLVSFLSASQDIVVDAFRRESLRDEELGMGSTVYIYGYRIALWVSGGLAFILADKLSWPVVYAAMAGGIAIGMIATLMAEEPKITGTKPRTFNESVTVPLKEFFGRKGVLSALTVLVFILLYKLGDTLAGAVAVKFYKDLHYSNAEIGTIAKTFGFASAMVGSFIGGAMILKIGIRYVLLVGGILQAFSTGCLALLPSFGHSELALAWVIGFEDVSAAIGTAAFAAFMATQTNKQYTAFQYAILTSIMGVPRTLLAAPAGIWAESLGYEAYFTICMVVAAPGLLLLLLMLRSSHFQTEVKSDAPALGKA